VTDKLDDLFSPERLRGKWTKKKRDEKQDHGTSAFDSSKGYEPLFNNARKLITSRFSGDSRKLLEELMDELTALLDLRFSSSDEEIPGINRAIDQLIAQIEDLVEAFEMQNRNP
jgi:hypothetical protein